MTLITNYLNFWTRVRKKFLSGFLIVTAIFLYSYSTNGSDFGLIGLMILGLGVIYMAFALIEGRTFINEVKFTEDKLVVTGHNFDSRWDKEIDIKNSDIEIKSKGRGAGNVDYFIRIKSADQTIDINRSFNWDYNSLLTIFHEFKRIKREKIIFDEKYFLELMEKKANRFSS